MACGRRRALRSDARGVAVRVGDRQHDLGPPPHRPVGVEARRRRILEPADPRRGHAQRDRLGERSAGVLRRLARRVPSEAVGRAARELLSRC